jgi:hypothetical protein
MKIELLVAIYGAVVATVVAFWNFYAWRRSNRLYLTGHTSADMQLDVRSAMIARADPSACYLMLCVSNRGHVPCTINTVWLLAYPSLWAYLRRKHSASVVVLRPSSESFGCALPYKLERASEFRAIALQNEKLEEMSRTSRLYMAVSHSMSEHAFRVRVRPIAERKSVTPRATAKAA